MGIIKNEIGQKYGYLTVMKQAPNRDKRAFWECQCDCGNIIVVSGSCLRRKKNPTRSCGCLNKQKEIGKKYNHLTVLSYSHTNDRGELIWNCKCDCGKNTTVKSRDLHSGHKKSCGCLYSPDLSGLTFGLLTVLERAYTNKNVLYWKCQCKCGSIINVPTNNLKSGNTSSCGCINYSIGEKNIAKWLDDNHIAYKKEWVIPNTYYRFDFALFDKNNNLIAFIEFDGEQHYKDNKGVWNSKENLAEIQKRDKIKNKYAIDQNISLIRIPYWERDNISKETLFNPLYFVHISTKRV